LLCLAFYGEPRCNDGPPDSGLSNMAKVLTMSPAMLPMPWDGLILRSKPRRRRPAKRDWRAAVESVRPVVCSDSARCVPPDRLPKIWDFALLRALKAVIDQSGLRSAFFMPSRGAASDVVPKCVSPTDLAAQWTGVTRVRHSLQLSHRRAVQCHR